MKNKLSIALLLFLTSIGAVAAEEATILEQDNSPILIENYTSRYKTPDRVGDGTIVHRTTVRNTSDQDVAAYGLGFYIFDSFKRDMGRPFVGYSMDSIPTNNQAGPGWEQRPGSAFLFETHGHGLAYVAIVRMADGSIWKADLDNISRQLEDFELEIDSESSD